MVRILLIGEVVFPGDENDDRGGGNLFDGGVYWS